jgi:hypothetical protein
MVGELILYPLGDHSKQANIWIHMVYQKTRVYIYMYTYMYVHTVYIYIYAYIHVYNTIYPYPNYSYLLFHTQFTSHQSFTISFPFLAFPMPSLPFFCSLLEEN